MPLELQSPCKVNFLLNILGKRPDGFHELETLMHPVPLCDRLTFEKTSGGVALTCSDPGLPTDGTNLVHRAATRFFERSGIPGGVAIHLEKKIPMAAGLGGGSGNAAITLLGLNDLFGHPLSPAILTELAAALGSDVPFFLQAKPALATGRGEKVESLDSFPMLRGMAMLLIHPGFGIATAWAYQKLADFPTALNGTPGRAHKLAAALKEGNASRVAAEFYNSLEAPALHKYPVLALYQEFLRQHGAWVALMSGSGSTTFAIFNSIADANAARALFLKEFGAANWTEVVGL